MMIVVVLLIFFEIATYFVLLYRLSILVRMRKPELFAAVGGLHVEDFLVLGFGTGDSLISKVEANDDLRREPDIARLLRWTRFVWFAQLVTAIGGVSVLLRS
jgi:hypothetical protein